MKKVLLLLVVVASVVFASCKKDKTDAPTYTKSQFVGITWVQTDAAAGDSAYIKFTDTKCFESTTYADLNSDFNGTDYTFDGKAMDMVFYKYTINSLSATQLVLTMTTPLSSASAKATFKKK